MADLCCPLCGGCAERLYSTGRMVDRRIEFACSRCLEIEKEKREVAEKDAYFLLLSPIGANRKLY